MFTCRECKSSEFNLDQMKKERRLVPTNRGICKPCATNYEKHQRFIRKSEKDPDNYMACDDCDRIFSKYSATNLVNGNKRLNIDCPFCKSENIDRF